MTYALLLVFALVSGLKPDTVAQDLSLFQCLTMRAALVQAGVPAVCVPRQGV